MWDEEQVGVSGLKVIWSAPWKCRRVSMSLRAVLFIAVLLTVLPRSIRAQSPIASFLSAELGFDDGEIERVGRGESVTIVLDGEDNLEIATFSAFRVTRDLDEILVTLGSTEAMLPGRGPSRAARLSSPPVAADFEPLVLEKSDLEDLEACRSHDCNVKLSDVAIERFRDVDWSAPDAASDANLVAREMLLGYASAYVGAGNRALAEYHDRREPQGVLSTFRDLLDGSRYLYDEVPDFRRHLLEYPDHRLASTDDFLFWAWEDFGMKPVFSVNHGSVYQTGRADGVAAAIGTMQIYASHYFRGALATTLLVRDTADRDSFYVLRLSRYGLDTPVGGLRRRLLERKLRGYAGDTAEALREMIG